MPKGKKRNALKHGAYAQTLMLWSEKFEDYELLRAGLDLEFSPAGAMESDLVQTLLDLLWRKRRLRCYEQITLQKRRDEIRQKAERSRAIDHLRSWADEFNETRSIEEVESILANFGPLFVNTIRSRWPLQTGEEPKNWGPRIAAGLSSLRPEPRDEHADEFMAMIDLEEFDAALLRMERLDAMIDKTVKRLVSLKTMKKVYNRIEPEMILVAAGSSGQGTDDASPAKTELPRHQV